MKSKAFAVILTALLAGCGGGSSSNDDDYVIWSGSQVDALLVDADRQSFAARTSDGQVVALAGKTVLRGLVVDRSGNIFSNGQQIGFVGLENSGGGSFAILKCNDGTYLDINEIASTYEVRCRDSSATAPTTGSGSSGGNGIVTVDRADACITITMAPADSSGLIWFTAQNQCTFSVKFHFNTSSVDTFGDLMTLAPGASDRSWYLRSTKPAGLPSAACPASASGKEVYLEGKPSVGGYCFYRP